MHDISTKVSFWGKLSIAGFTLGGSVFVLQGLQTPARAWLLLLLLAFAILTAFATLPKVVLRQHIVLAGMYLLCIAMSIYIHQHLAMLYVVICLSAIESLNKRMAMLWVAACVLAVFAIEVLAPNGANWQDAIVNSILAMFLSGFAYLRIEAENSKRQSRELLHELEEKNLQLATMAAEQEQQSRMEERQSLSRELHDTLGHKLTTSIVQLEAAEKFIEQDPTRVKGILNTARTLLKDGLEETRNIVQLLDQDKSVKQSLAERLTQLAKGFESATGIVITLELDCDEAIIPSHYKHHLLRIVQEALTNVSRHAQATEVTITLNTQNGIALSVEDNGVSLNQSQREQLPPVKSIESRVTELNGILNFIRNDTITQLQVEIPLKAMSANNAD